MATIDEILNPNEHDLTPDGDSAGNPPPGPKSANELTGERTEHDPEAIDEMLWPNTDVIDVNPRIEAPRYGDITEATKRHVTTRVLRNVLTLAPGSDPVRMFPADPNRQELILRAVDPGDPLSDSTAGQSTFAQGSVTSPGALANIVTLAIATEGTYDIQWTVQLSGTLGAPELNNFGVHDGALQVGQSINGITAGIYVQQTTRAYVPAGTTMAVYAIGAGTVGAIYTAGITLTPVIIYEETQPWGWAGEKADCYWGSSPAQYMYTTDGDFRTPHHTGEVWVFVPSTAKDSVRIQGWVITT